MRIYPIEILVHALNQASYAVDRYVIAKAKGQKVLKISEINIHEMVVESMCEFSYELRFGQIVDALCTYLLNQPEDVRTVVMMSSLDTLYSVLVDLVKSKDVKKRSERMLDRFLPVEYFSLRKGLLREVGYSVVRNRDEPLNYQSGGDRYDESETVAFR